MRCLGGADEAGASRAKGSGRALQPAGTPTAEANLGRLSSTNPAPSSLDLWRLAAERAPMVNLWRRLLDEHVPDSARRCRTCTKGGTGLPSLPWPCPLYGIANMARRSYEGA